MAATTLTGQAALIWTGGGDGISLYQEANWQDDNGLVPAAGTINGNTAVTAATGGFIEITSGAGTPSNYGGNFTLGANDFEVGGGKIIASGSAGIRVAAAGDPTNQSGILTGASTVNVTFILDLDWTVDGASTMRLKGAGTPVNRSSINVLDTGSILQFDGKTYADFDSSIAGFVTFGGGSLAFGADPFAVEPGDNALASAFNGANGVEISFVPEPSSALLFGLGGLALILRRRK